MRTHSLRIRKSICILFLLLCIPIGMLGGCTAASVSEGPEYTIQYTEADMSGYRNMDAQDHVFRAITFETLIDLFRHQGTAIVWLSRTNCLYCQNTVWIVNNAAKDAGIPVYYIDAATPLSETGTLEENEQLYEELCEYIQEALRMSEDGTLGMYVPLLLNIQSGILINYHVTMTDSFTLDENDTIKEEDAKKMYDLYREVME